jgi:hypothetical protein
MQPYDPPLADFCDILKDYSLSGLNFFRGLGARDQDRVRRTIGPTLIEDERQQIEYKFSQAKSRKSPSFNFIPMPKPTGDFAVSFFVPRFRFVEGGHFRCAFCLIAWVDHGDGQTISFRLEPADEDDTTHSYNHIQLSRSVRSPDMATTMPTWIPQSYPAFPLGLSTPLQFFAATTVAVHGYSRKDKALYIGKAIMTGSGESNAASRTLKVLTEIHRIFDSAPFR